MIRSFFQRWKEEKAVQDWRKSSLGKMLSNHTDEYFTQCSSLAEFSDDTKQKVVEDFYKAVLSLPQAENPFLAMRERLAFYATSFAELQVLCLTESEKADAFYSDCSYISGQIHHHIDKAVEHIVELQELKWKHPGISNEDLISYCNSRCALHLYYLNGFNYVRTEFDDIDRDKDWLRPFLKSMLIWNEDQIRSNIGLQSLLPDTFDSIKHGTFMKFVVNGHKNPYFEWEKSWG